MLKKIEWSGDRSYRTESNSEPIQFYLDGLCNSSRFDLLLGYFSSAAINVLSLGFAKFLHSGGEMRMIVNNILSEEDKNAFKVAEEGQVQSLNFDLYNIKYLRNTLDEYGRHFFECLAWLIYHKKIQIKIIRPKRGKGIAHYKSGVFYDSQYSVGFKASCNFTAYGLLENLEELDAFLSWENSRSSKMINRQSGDFENLFSGNADYVEYLNVDEIQIAIRDQFGDKNLHELLIQEKDLLKKKSRIFGSGSIKKVFEKVTFVLDELTKLPRFPYPSGPREYQKTAYENWCNNNFQGIFAMATGTGKTITSLNCLLQETLRSDSKTYHALIIVPTITLVNQWEEEARGFNFQDIIKISSKEDWENQVATTLSTAKRIKKSFIVITTYASFIRDRFFKYISSFPSDTILIADEAHNIGSPSVLEKLNLVSFEKRIALSATPKRIYDPEGSAKMEAFFNDKEPYTYSFPMERAIEEGILCKYYYYPHIVTLKENELAEYIEISKKLSKFYHPGNESLESNEIVEKLLLKRKRIIHKAENKLEKTITNISRYDNIAALSYSLKESSAKEYNKKKRDLSKDTEKSENLELDRQKLEQKIRDLELQELQLKDNLANAEERSESLLNKLSEAQKIRELEATRKGIHSNLQSVQEEFDKAQIGFHKKMFTNKWVLKGTASLFDSYSKIYQDYEQRKLEKEAELKASQKAADKMIKEMQTRLPIDVPEPIHVERMLEMERCLVCDRPAEKESEPWLKMKEILDRSKMQAQDLIEQDERRHNFSNNLKKLYQNGLSMSHFINSVDNDIATTLEQIGKLDEKRRSLKEEYDAIENKVKSVIAETALNLSDAENLLNEFSSQNEMAKTFQRQVDSLAQIIHVRKSELNSIDEKLSELVVGEIPTYLEEKVEALIDFHTVAHSTRKRVFDKLVKMLEQEANKHYQEMTKGNLSTKGIIRLKELSNGKNYMPELVDENGKVLLQLNTSNIILIKLATIMAIVSARQSSRDTELYTLITDAPMSVFGEDYTIGFCKTVSKVYKQSIIMSKEFYKNETLRKELLTNAEINLGKVYMITPSIPESDRTNRNSLTTNIKPLN
jgi:superfamily II DNA or RNA helicase